jgi:hypothetical protein
MSGNVAAHHTGKLATLLLVAWSATMPAVYGQYYESREEEESGSRAFTAGLLRFEFTPRPTNTLADSAAIRGAALLPMLAFRQGLVEIYVGYTRFEERGSTRSAVVFGTQVARDIPLGGPGPGGLALPLMVAADYTKVSSGALQRDDFNLASIGLGAGLGYRSGGPDMEFWIRGVEVFHVAFQGVASGTGTSLTTVGEAGLFLRRVPIGKGLVLGYRVRLQTWSLSDERFNYRALYHGPSVGILF